MRLDTALRWGAVVVAAACAVAVALLIGAGLRPVRYRGREECAAQLAKLGQALRAYANDHDGYFPITETPADAEERLLPLLTESPVTRQDFYCPALAGPDPAPYTYHCYRDRGSTDWPKWMPDSHLVTKASPPETWLMADYLPRDSVGPHSTSEKAYNYLRVDGSVGFSVGRPREVYQ